MSVTSWAKVVQALTELHSKGWEVQLRQPRRILACLAMKWLPGQLKRMPHTTREHRKPAREHLSPRLNLLMHATMKEESASWETAKQGRELLDLGARPAKEVLSIRQSAPGVQLGCHADAHRQGHARMSPRYQ